jgi:uncharacterized protein (TIGR02996 family)
VTVTAPPGATLSASVEASSADEYSSLMSCESLDLLAAVLDSPSDDAPRLVYADWLDEHGQADRAEFIRLQCEMARSDHEHAQFGRSYILMDRRWLAGRRAAAAGCPCRWCELRRRAQALLRESDCRSRAGT